MSQDLSLSKLAELARSLSAKECALLVIGYYQQEKKDGKEYKEEIKTVASTISPYASDAKRKEYVFYYKLWWSLGLFELDLQTCMLDLQIMANQLQSVSLGLTHDVVNYHNLILFMWMPKILTKKQFEDTYNKERKKRLSEVIAFGQVVRYEAFHKLQEEGYFSKKDDYLEEVDYEDEKFKTEAKTQEGKLRQAIDKGILKSAKVKEKLGWYHNGTEYIGQDGILAQSWYDYRDKLDQDFNSHLDNKGELVEWETGRYAVAKEGTLLSRLNKSNITDGEETRQYFEKRLRDILLIKEEEKVLDFADDDYRNLILLRLKDTQEWIQRLINHIEVISKIEREIFGKEVSVNDLRSKARDLIAQTVERQNNSIPELLNGYNVLRKNTKLAFTFKDANKYTLQADLKPEQEWVDDTVGQLIEIANDESGYNYVLEK